MFKISKSDGNNKDFHNLIVQLKNGDEHAFGELYKKAVPSVAFACHKFCTNKEDAEEAVQDTFLIAFKKSTDLTFDTFAVYLAYLRKIAIHESFRKRNESNRRKSLFVESDGLEIVHEELNANFLPAEALLNKESSAELMKMVNSLSKMQNEMIYMYYFADLSIE